jgi:hypothetical protein
MPVVVLVRSISALPGLQQPSQADAHCRPGSENRSSILDLSDEHNLDAASEQSLVHYRRSTRSPLISTTVRPARDLFSDNRRVRWIFSPTRSIGYRVQADKPVA